MISSSRCVLFLVIVVFISRFEWPLRNLVVVWITTLALSDSGCCSSGVANVLLTTTCILFLRGAAQIVVMLVTLSSGFVGDLIHIRLVLSSRVI